MAFPPRSLVITFFSEEEDTDEYDDYSIGEFRSINHTPEKYLEFWKNSQKMRLRHIENIESLSQILEKWPEYKQHNAVTYVIKNILHFFKFRT